MSTTTKTAAAKPIRGEVNTKVLLSTLKHMFGSSLSYVGELMQNARRAGATQVDFEIDVDAKKVTVRDNGDGVRDFEALVSLCRSDWSQQVTLDDKPFGMGLFSAFHAAKRVTVRSQGRKLDVSLDNIIDGVELKTPLDPQAPVRGTVIELHDVVLEPSSHHIQSIDPIQNLSIYRELEHNAQGFPIDVSVNGKMLARPYAQSNLKGVHTPIGFVSHRSFDWGALQAPDLHICFLQGLPIHVYGTANAIVHLDSTRFIARMPDRTHLFDADKQGEIVVKGLRDCVRQRLVHIKSEIKDLSSEEGAKFVQQYWDLAGEAGFLEIFDNIPWIPAEALNRIADASARADDTRSLMYGPPIPMSSFVEGKIKVWRNLPHSSLSSPWASALLSLAVSQSVHEVVPRFKLSPGHWLQSIGRDAEQLRLKVIPTHPSGSEHQFSDFSDISVRVRLAETLSLHARFADDPQSSFVLPVDFVVTPNLDGDPESLEFFYDDVSISPSEVGGIEDQEASSPNFDCTIYVSPKFKAFHAALLQVFAFLDDNDGYDDEWLDENALKFQAAVNRLKGSGLSDQVNLLLESRNLDLSAEQSRQLCVIASSADDTRSGQSRLHALALDEAMLSRVSEHLEQAGVVALAPQVLQSALQRAVCDTLGLQWSHFEEGGPGGGDDDNDNEDLPRPRGG